MAPRRTSAGWVIEHFDSEPGRPLYWTGKLPNDTRAWDHDRNEAIRFASEEDARNLHLRLMPDVKIRINEVAWG